MFIEAISKKFDVEVFQNITFRFEKGRKYAIFGKNGSGKSTLLRIMNGDLAQDNGELDFAQYDIMFIRNNTMPFPFMTALEFIEQTCELKAIDYDQQKINQLLEEFDLSDRASDRLGTYSAGMQYKVLLMIAMLSKIDLLLLDEPFTELDLITVNKLGRLFDIYLPSTTLIFTTHSLDIAQKVAQECLLLSKTELKTVDQTSVELEQVLLQEMENE